MCLLISVKFLLYNIIDNIKLLVDHPEFLLRVILIIRRIYKFF